MAQRYTLCTVLIQRLFHCKFTDSRKIQPLSELLATKRSTLRSENVHIVTRKKKKVLKITLTWSFQNKMADVLRLFRYWF